MRTSDLITISRHERSRTFTATAVLTCSLVFGGCATNGSRAGVDDGPPSVPTLNRIANQSLSSGYASVRLVDGVAYVSGNVDTALDERRIVRSLSRVEGIERVETNLRRGM